MWEDYAEHDGVDEPQLHTQRITLTRTAADDPDGERLILDFDGTSPQAKGPINHCGDYSDGVFLKKWLAPILRNLADTPERMAELDVNEGVVPLIEMRFPPPGTLLTPVFPAPTNARTFVILRLLGVLAGVRGQGRRRPDAGRPGDDPLHRRLRRGPRRPALPDARGARRRLRRPLLRRRRGHHPRRARTRGTCRPSSPRRGSRSGSSRSALAIDSGGAGQFRGGLGYEKHIRMLKDAHFMSIADRSILACWGVKGGLAGTPFQVTIDPGGPNEREVDALADAEPVKAGEVIRIRTTGGGGWGDPLERDPELVVRDVVWRKVSPRGRAGDVRRGADRRRLDDDSSATTPTATARRAARRGRAPPTAFFDRGPGYARLAGGADARRRRPGAPDDGVTRVAVVGGNGKTGVAVV